MFFFLLSMKCIAVILCDFNNLRNNVTKLRNNTVLKRTLFGIISLFYGTMSHEKNNIRNNAAILRKNICFNLMHEQKIFPNIC